MNKLHTLKCDQCNLVFDEYCKPKFLPCGKTICNTCEFNIIKGNRQFKCGICEEYHYIPNDGFTVNKEMYDLITAKQAEIPTTELYHQFELNLNNTKSLVERFDNFDTIAINTLNDHCLEEKRKVQLETEIKKQNIQEDNEKLEQINKLTEELIDVIDMYEQKCINDFFSKTESIKLAFNELLNEVNTFLNDKQEYLNRNNTNDNEMNIFNSQLIEYQTKLNRKLNELNNIIFDNNKIEFINKTFDQSDLGYIDYNCFKVIIF